MERNGKRNMKQEKCKQNNKKMKDKTKTSKKETRNKKLQYCTFICFSSKKIIFSSFITVQYRISQEQNHTKQIIEKIHSFFFNKIL